MSKINGKIKKHKKGIVLTMVVWLPILIGLLNCMFEVVD